MDEQTHKSVNDEILIEKKLYASYAAVPRPEFVRKLQTQLMEQAVEKPHLSINHQARKKFFSHMTWGIASIVILAAIFLFTPPGRVLAHNILHFFSRSEEEYTLPVASPVSMVAVTPGITQPTLTPTPISGFSAVCEKNSNPICSLEQIRKMVDFPVKGLAELPAGFSFIGATGRPDQILLLYRRNDGQSSLVLIQEKFTKKNTQALKVSNETVVENVKIGSLDGEYVLGSWEGNPGEQELNWDPTFPQQTLRWQEEEVLITMFYTVNPDLTSNQMDKDYLLSLANKLTTSEILTFQPTATVQPGSIIYENTDELERAAGFEIVEPAWLPEGYHLQQAKYLPEMQAVCLEYSHPSDTEGNSLSIVEYGVAPLPTLAELSSIDPQYFETQMKTVGGAQENQGLFASNIQNQTKVCGNLWQDQVLLVASDQGNFAIWARSVFWNSKNHDFLTPQQMIKVAESITGVKTISDDQLDPDYITSIADAERLAGFHIKLPTRLPEGVSFDHIQVENKGPVTTVQAYYQADFFVIVVNIISGGSDTLDSLRNDPRNPVDPDHPWFDIVELRGTEGMISQGLFDSGEFLKLENGGDGSASLVWFEDGMKYVIRGFNAYPKDVWLDIAESMK